MITLSPDGNCLNHHNDVWQLVEGCSSSHGARKIHPSKVTCPSKGEISGHTLQMIDMHSDTLLGQISWLEKRNTILSSSLPCSIKILMPYILVLLIWELRNRCTRWRPKQKERNRKQTLKYVQCSNIEILECTTFLLTAVTLSKLKLHTHNQTANCLWHNCRQWNEIAWNNIMDITAQSRETSLLFTCPPVTRMRCMFPSVHWHGMRVVLIWVNSKKI